MNKKIIFALILLFMAVIFLSSASAIWPFDSGSDVTVNGVKFHLPEGFDANKPQTSKSENTYQDVVYKNNDNKDTIEIIVEDKSAKDTIIRDSLIKEGFEEKTIAGKDGFYKFFASSKNVEFVYIDNNKIIYIVTPFIYDEHGDNFMKYDELIPQIIK